MSHALNPWPPHILNHVALSLVRDTNIIQYLQYFSANIMVSVLQLTWESKPLMLSSASGSLRGFQLQTCFVAACIRSYQNLSIFESVISILINNIS